jgi:hypothetical protein
VFLWTRLIVFVPRQAFGHGKPGTKKYCRHHKKRCKKNVRSLDGRLKVRFKGWGVGAGWKPGKSNAAVTDEKVYFDVMLQTGDEPVVNYSSESGGDLDYSCPNDGQNEYWVCNGKQSFKRGKATLRTVSHAYGNLFNDLLYRMSHRTE